mmetsp:Transcript_43058/g.79889  ORF Transcript_43058/g.79889 Transcript_43058/m.79889 type:complete len:86 (+) Transcript_43058:780-1037(+)
MYRAGDAENDVGGAEEDQPPIMLPLPFSPMEASFDVARKEEKMARQRGTTTSTASESASGGESGGWSRQYGLYQRQCHHMHGRRQ